jgi:hypothetical protein
VDRSSLELRQRRLISVALWSDLNLLYRWGSWLKLAKLIWDELLNSHLFKVIARWTFRDILFKLFRMLVIGSISSQDGDGVNILARKNRWSRISSQYYTTENPSKFWRVKDDSCWQFSLSWMQAAPENRLLAVCRGVRLAKPKLISIVLTWHSFRHGSVGCILSTRTAHRESRTTWVPKGYDCLRIRAQEERFDRRTYGTKITMRI